LTPKNVRPFLILAGFSNFIPFYTLFYIHFGQISANSSDTKQYGRYYRISKKLYSSMQGIKKGRFLGDGFLIIDETLSKGQKT